MKNLGYIPILSLLLNSCIVMGTLYPISDKEADFIFKKELLGTWVDPTDSSDFFSVDTTVGINGKFYNINYMHYKKEKNRTDTTYISARLAQINKSYFLDCTINTGPDSLDTQNIYSIWLIKRHFFCKIAFPVKDKIEFCTPSSEEFIKLIDQKKINLNYTKLDDDNYLILDKPKALRNALTNSLKFPLLYNEIAILQKLN